MVPARFLLPGVGREEADREDWAAWTPQRSPQARRDRQDLLPVTAVRGLTARSVSGTRTLSPPHTAQRSALWVIKPQAFSLDGNNPPSAGAQGTSP